MAATVSGIVYTTILTGKNASLDPVLTTIEKVPVEVVQEFWLTADGGTKATIYSGDFGTSIQVMEEQGDGTWVFPQTERVTEVDSEAFVRRGPAEVTARHLGPTKEVLE